MSTLEFGTTVFEGLHAVTVSTAMRSVNVLALSDYDLSLYVAINFLRCFPCLKKLYMKSRGVDSKNEWRQEHLEHVECLDLHLKIIALSNYLGNNKSHVRFVTFFVLNARVLESMKLVVDDGLDTNERWIEKQRRKLQLSKRASGGAQFDFEPKKYFRHFSDVHELSDPFERKC
ncbi:hypothetical protein ACP4OV_029147 [Aristida adscensionis]